METVAKLLDSAGTKEEKGYTALHLAVQAGNSDLVRQLLALPACDPSAKDVDGLTALHWAASKGALLPPHPPPGPPQNHPPPLHPGVITSKRCTSPLLSPAKSCLHLEGCLD